MTNFKDTNTSKRPFKWHLIGFFGLLLLMTSCSKEEGLGKDPYAGGKSPLGINISEAAPFPNRGTAGDTITYKAKGLFAYKDKVKCYFNETPAEVVSISETDIRIRIPEGASTGGLTLVVDDQIFFGPLVSITGKTNVDPTFLAGVGANSFIRQVTPAAGGNLVIVGAFTNYQNKGTISSPVRGIALINSTGEYLSSFASGTGPDGPLSSIAKLSNGQFALGGRFNRYNGFGGINNMTKINPDGSLETQTVTLLNLTPLKPENSFDTVAAFNGGVTFGSPVKVFAAKDNKIIAVGSFEAFADYFYERSTKESKILGTTQMNMVVRLHADGRLDSTYNFDMAANQTYKRANGSITDAILMDDDRLVLVGDFTEFQGVKANRMVRLKANGTVDPEFNSGTGANGPITSLRYHKANGKLMIAGPFTSYNGQPANGVAMLNADGSLDPSFRLKALSGGKANFAVQLNSGLIIVSGTFNKYDNVVRQGFMILNADGSLAEGYNNIGRFQGLMSDAYETTSPLGLPAVLLVGFISKFNGVDASNIVQITMEP